MFSVNVGIKDSVSFSFHVILEGRCSEQLRRAEGSQVESPHGLLGLDAGHVSTSPPQSYTDSVQQPQDSGCERGWLDHPVVRALQVGARIGTEGLLSS